MSDERASVASYIVAELQRLAIICADANASQEVVLWQARRARDYGATADQIRNTTGPWPHMEDL